MFGHICRGRPQQSENQDKRAFLRKNHENIVKLQKTAASGFFEVENAREDSRFALIG